MFGLSIDNLRDIKNCFVQFPQINKALLYGSRAKGNYKSGSDIDITLIGKNLNLSNTIYPLQGKLDKLYLPYQFDISIFDKLDNPAFIEHILRVGKTLYQKPQTYPKHWQVKPLGEVCRFVRGPFGGSLKKSIFVDKGIAVYEQQHAIYNQFHQVRYFITDKKFKTMQRFELLPNDLIMSCSGTMGKMAIVPKNIKKGIINQALLKLTTSEKLEVQFLKSWMESKGFQDEIIKHSQGAAIKNIASVKVLKQIKIPIPPLAEQQAIVKKLDALFSQVKQAKSQLEQNLQNAKDLWQSSLNQVFNNPDNDWAVKALKDIGEIQTGTTPPTKEKQYYGKFIPFVKPPHFNKSGIIDTGDSMLSKLGLEKGRLFKENSVLMVCIGATIGKTGYVNTPVSANQQINSITPNENYYPKILYYALITNNFFNQVLSQSSQATLPMINKSKWQNLFVCLPKDIETQQAIVKKLDAINQQTQQLTQNIQNQLKSLETLEKSLLEKAFYGGL